MQQSKNDIQRVAIKTDLYPVLLMAQYLPKAQALALLKQVKVQSLVLNNQALKSALSADVQRLQERVSTDWPGIYQRIALLHRLIPKLVPQEKSAQSASSVSVKSTEANQSKISEYWQEFKDKLGSLVVVERQGDHKNYQSLQLAVSQLSTAVMDLNQDGYQQILLKIFTAVKADFSDDKTQQQLLKNLTWLKSQSIAPTAVTLQSLNLLKQTHVGQEN
ncbi:hypothetical protein [Piscirickettsia litoralis]|uniref:hypothetical protein n=1 Tax=Piscirickettsia litoralis TaxID=1891921 RepID=UPI001F46691F|nr:hypothetical protein [Piscirickettsia litoralis]